VPKGEVPAKRGFRPPGPGPRGMAEIEETPKRPGPQGCRSNRQGTWELSPLTWLPFPPGEPRFREGGGSSPSLAPLKAQKQVQK